jgi:Holliday junction DNA helicase RuvA
VIASLSGIVESKEAEEAILDVGGVGYRVFISMRSMARLPSVGEKLKLRIRTIVREDALDLYGFTSYQEEKLFLLLTSVSHVGPKLAMTVLSGMEPTDLANAIASADIARITKIHGVGKKTAERIVVELKDKVSSLAGEVSIPAVRIPLAQKNDLVTALVNLGYKPVQAQKAAEQAEKAVGSQAGMDVLIREALRAARG